MADRPFEYTVEALQRASVDVDVIDVVTLAVDGTFYIPVSQIDEAVLSIGGARWRLGDYRSAYMRLVDVGLSAPSSRLRGIVEEGVNVLHRVFSDVELPIINPILRDCSNFAKAFHSARFGAVGPWRVPRTCLTNDVEEAQAFIASCAAGVIFKGASGAKTWARRYDRESHENRLSMLSACPVLFQEMITGPDVRVHLVGNEAFGEAIHSTAIDYRVADGNRYEPIEVPDAIVAGIERIAEKSELPLIGVDFKIETSTGDWVFLEANPQPAYNFYDRRADGAIARAIVRWLQDPPEGARQWASGHETARRARPTSLMNDQTAKGSMSVQSEV